MKKLISFLLLFLILLFATGLRLYKLSEIPPGLNRDEAAIGYTAFSLLETGKDEYGKLWPISLKSFGDWKLPVYVYLTIPSVAIFGLNEFAVRLPSVICSLLTIIFVYFLTKKIFKSNAIALTICTLISISPWNIFFSRVASEANATVLLVTIAIFTFFVTEKKFYWLILGSICLGLSLLTYHGNHVFTPLLFIGCLILFKNKFLSKPWGWVSVGVFCIISIFIYGQTLFSADKTKISGLTPLGDISLVHENINLNRIIYPNQFFGRLLNNKVIFLGEQITKNYLQSFSPEFLFISGGTNLQHNIPDFGNLYKIEGVLILIGLFLLFYRKEKTAWFWLYWILISPIAGSLTKDAPHSARMYAIIPAIYVIIGYGLIKGLNLIKNLRIKKIVILIVGLAFIVDIGLFTGRYFILFSYKAYKSWGLAYKEMILKLDIYKSNYDLIYISRPDYSPYIYYLFYNQASPQLFQTYAIHYPETSEGFSHVKSFDGVVYEKNNWTDELLIPDNLYIDWAESIPSGATNSATYITKDKYTQMKKSGIDISKIKVGDVITSKIIDKVIAPDTSPIFYLISTQVGTSSALIKNF